jgi:hypothetical protein
MTGNIINVTFIPKKSSNTHTYLMNNISMCSLSETLKYVYCTFLLVISIGAFQSVNFVFWNFRDNFENSNELSSNIPKLVFSRLLCFMFLCT